jgi:hypothetical protein
LKASLQKGDQIMIRSISSSVNFIVRPIVELRCVRRFVCSDLLGLLDRSAVLEVGRGARGPERVAARMHV